MINIMGRQLKKKKKFFWFDLPVCIFWLAPGFDLIFSLPFLAQHVPSTEIDSGISQAIRNSNKISIENNSR